MRSETISSGSVDDDLQARTEGMLDDALGNLNERDRNAVLLRFFHGRSLREVGEAQGVSEDAAKRRVLRAVEKLRNYFSRKGVNVPSVALIELMGKAVKPASSHVAQSAIQAGLAKSAIANTGWLSHAILSWQNIAVGIAVAGAIVGAVVMTGRTGSIQTAVQPSRPAVLIAAAVNSAPLPAPAATQPALTQDTPANALIKLFTAMEQNDRAAIGDTVYTAQTPHRPTLSPDAPYQLAAIFHLQQVWQEKFGVAMTVPGYSYATLPAGTFAMLRTLVKAEGDGIKIDGDMAQFTWPLGPDIFGGSGPDRFAAAARWDGAQMVLRHVNGDWKLDLDRTFDQLISVNRLPGNDKDAMEISALLERETGSGFNDLAGQIEDGTIASAAEASNAAKAISDQAFKDAGVRGENENTLPVIGGEVLSRRDGGAMSKIFSSLMGGTATAPAAATTTRPQGQDNPVDALSKLCTAMEQNDQPAINECICDDGVDPNYATLGRSWMLADAAVIRIEKDWSEKFGQGMAVSGLNFDMFPSGPFNIVLRGILEDPNGANVKIDGEEAKVRIPLPPETFALRGPARFAPMERWSGAMLVLRQTDGVWKLDTDRSFNFAVTVNRMKGNNDDAIDITAKTSPGVVVALNDVASQIENGKLTTSRQASAVIEAKVGAAFKSAKVNGVNVAALPVIGGTP